MNFSSHIVVTSEDFLSVIDEVIIKVSDAGAHAAVITLTGDLGAGKTTFTQQLAQHLGITEPVVSPTFGIMKVYEIVDHAQFDQLVHIDAYRIEDESEIGPLRIRELFSQPRALICIEWPEHIASVIPDYAIELSIEIAEGETRIVNVA